MKILDIHADWVLDSRATPTVRVIVWTEKGYVVGMAPSGASTGSHEAIELRDHSSDFQGKHVTKAVSNLAKLKDLVLNRDTAEWREIVREILAIDDRQKSNLGANLTTAVSIALVKAHALATGVEPYQIFGKKHMPRIMANLINGGKHAGNDLMIQEFMVFPKPTGEKAVKIIAEVYLELKKILKMKYGKTAINVGDEGGFAAPQLKSNEEALELLNTAVEELGYQQEVNFAIDAAASEFYHLGKYEVVKGKFLTAHELIDYYLDLISKYKIESIEDPFDENNFEEFAELKKKVSSGIWIVGDDLLTTNPERIKKAQELSSCNALLLKINQIGSVIEAEDAFTLAKSADWGVIVSHRSGETEDPFIIDFAVGKGADAVKIGAPARGERTCKYNRLLFIERYCE